MTKLVSIFGDRDPREVPLYTIGQAAGYLGVAPSTIRTWVVGMDYPVAHKRTGRFEPLIKIPHVPPPARLTFNNLIEAYVLTTLRRVHHVELGIVRQAIKNVKETLGDERPLLSTDFVTDGVRIYLETVKGNLIDVSQRGAQVAFKDFVEKSLERIERSPEGIAMRLFPFAQDADEPKIVSIDPRRSFGKPTITGSGVEVAVVADLVGAGETPERVAKEFGLATDVVRRAVVWHKLAAA